MPLSYPAGGASPGPTSGGGFVVYNVLDTAFAGGAKGDGAANDTPSIQSAINAAKAANGGTVYLPSNPTGGHYKITSPLTISGSTSQQVRLVGEKGVGGFGSKIIGNFAGYLIDHTNSDEQMLAGVSGLVLQNPHASGGGIRVENSQQCIIEHVYMQTAWRGIYADQNAYNTHIRNSVIGGLNNAVGSIGIMAGQVIVSECSIVGWDEGVRAHNAGFCLENSRVEVNLTGVRLGVSPAGGGSTLGGSVLKANTFERNNTGILVEGVGGCAITGNFVTGTANVADTGECLYGIRTTGGCQGLQLGGNTVAGTFSQAGYSLEHLYSDGSEVYQGNVANNASAVGGVNWRCTKPVGKIFIGCEPFVKVTVTTGDIILNPDCHQIIHTNAAAANIIYIRDDTNWNGEGGIAPVGWRYAIVQRGAGRTQFVSDGATILFPGGGTPRTKTTAQGSVVFAEKLAASTWVVYGDLSV